MAKSSETKKAETLDGETNDAGVENSGADGREKSLGGDAAVQRAEAGDETIEKLKSELEQVRQEAKDEHDRLLRLSAEFENYKKRMNRQSDEFKKYANESLLKDLLTVVDNLERAITSTDGDRGVEKEGCVVEGVEMTLNEILKILRNYHVEPIEAKGKPFDPVYHEAMMQEETDEHPENTVVNELQKGYMLHDRLLRPAMVVVSKPKSKNEK
ncbi:MAG TPA: nucleotide exchange factor GrpE [Desulfosalsimonadaceae bacterium]|nr:nucleotide exchange factor GrpE [Desulfosalsimonadaceae bacterium]